MIFFVVIVVAVLSKGANKYCLYIRFSMAMVLDIFFFFCLAQALVTVTRMQIIFKNCTQTIH